MGAYGDTALAAQSAPEYIRIDYPNYYTDWQASVGHAILWHSYNVSGNVISNSTMRREPRNWPTLPTYPPRRALMAGARRPAASRATPTARYVIRITADADNTISSTSREPFSVPITTSHYYINDSSTAGDEYTTAIGSDRNTGTTPGRSQGERVAPAEILRHRPGRHGLHRYGLCTSRSATSSSAAIRRSAPAPAPSLPGPTTTTRPPSTAATPTPTATNIELDDAGSVTLTHLSLVGANLGLWVHDQSIRFTGTYLTLADNAGTGMTVESDSSQSVFGNLTAYDNGGDGIDISTAIASLSSSSAHNNGSYGIYLSNQGPAIVQNDLAYGNGSYGIYLSGSGPALVQDDTAYGNQTGIYVYNSAAGSPAIVGDPNLSSDPSVATNGNQVYDNSSVGIYAGGNVLAAGNTIYGQASSDAAGI